MNLHHLEHADLSSIAGALVGLSYLLYFIAQLLVVFISYRKRSYGMPLMSCAALMGIAFACVIGPFSDQKHLFYDPSRIAIFVVWLVSFLLQLLMFLQYIFYARSHPHVLPELHRYFYWIAAFSAIASFAFVWLYIIFYQDFYVNEIFPLMTLLMAIGYFGTLYTRVQLRGLSVSAAWLYTLGIGLLYLGTALGDMSDPFPEAKNGYGWIYFVWAATVVVMAGYSLLLGRRRQELRDDWTDRPPQIGFAAAARGDS